MWRQHDGISVLRQVSQKLARRMGMGDAYDGETGWPDKQAQHSALVEHSVVSTLHAQVQPTSPFQLRQQGLPCPSKFQFIKTELLPQARIARGSSSECVRCAEKCFPKEQTQARRYPDHWSAALEPILDPRLPNQTEPTSPHTERHSLFS